MSTNLIQTVGIIAATCTTISFVPQLIKTIKTRDTKCISLLMYSITVIGVSLWLVYGLLIHDIPLILANTITVLLAGVILVMKIRHG